MTSAYSFAKFLSVPLTRRTFLERTVPFKKLRPRLRRDPKLFRLSFATENAFVWYESVMKRLRVTETLMGVVFVRRNKVGWMLPASFAGDTVRSDYSRTPGVAAHPAVVL